MSFRRLFFLVLLAGLPTMTWAQFTTYIAPQTKVVEAAKAAAVVKERVRTDSVMRIKLTEMKAWVDSAAGSVAIPPTVAEPPVSPRTPKPTPTPAAPARDTAAFTRAAADSALRFRHGTRAPDTASDLPMLALIGAIALAIGTVMLAGTQLGRDRA